MADGKLSSDTLLPVGNSYTGWSDLATLVASGTGGGVGLALVHAAGVEE